MATTTIVRGDVLVVEALGSASLQPRTGAVALVDRTGRATLSSNGLGLATLVRIETPGGFGTSGFGLSFGLGGGQPNAEGQAAIVATLGQATLQTTTS